MWLYANGEIGQSIELRPRCPSAGSNESTKAPLKLWLPRLRKCVEAKHRNPSKVKSEGWPMICTRRKVRPNTAVHSPNPAPTACQIKTGTKKNKETETEQAINGKLADLTLFRLFSSQIWWRRNGRSEGLPFQKPVLPALALDRQGWCIMYVWHRLCGTHFARYFSYVK